MSALSRRQLVIQSLEHLDVLDEEAQSTGTDLTKLFATAEWIAEHAPPLKALTDLVCTERFEREIAQRERAFKGTFVGLLDTIREMYKEVLKEMEARREP